MGTLFERLDELYALGGGRGANRPAGSAAESEACALAAQWMEEAGLTVARDAFGNVIGRLRGTERELPEVWAGSHLDSVRDGGIYDGPLGVAAAFEVAARASVPLAVICLADEEGARYNTPTFGSRALVGRLDVAEVLERRDEHGIAMREAMIAAGVDPHGLSRAPEWLARLRGFLELHIDQTRELAQDGHPAGVVSSLASRLRVLVDLRGRADHAGTTRRDERRDAMSAAAEPVELVQSLKQGLHV